MRATEGVWGKCTHRFTHQLCLSNESLKFPVLCCGVPGTRKVLILSGCRSLPRKPTWLLHSEEAVSIFSRCRGRLWWAVYFSFCFILSRNLKTDVVVQIILASGLRQGHGKLEASLGYSVRPCLQNRKRKKT